MYIHNDILSTIGNTPLVRLTEYFISPASRYWQSLRHKPHRQRKGQNRLKMIEQAEREGV